MTTKVIQTTGLRKTFTSREKGKSKKVEAVRGLDFHVIQDEIFGLLGPNGAGKTTTMRMLCTLLPPTEGNVSIMNFDLIHQQGEIRKIIGYVGQKGGLEQRSTGRENLILQARLYGMTAKEAATRTDRLLGELNLNEFADRKVKTYSGGQRRIFDLAAGIIHKPEILFLDEPTTGLDPQSRSRVWKAVQKLNQDGTTIVLTTHYLEEADVLCNRVAIIDHGLIVAIDHPAELKRKIIAGDILALQFESKEMMESAKMILDNESYTKEIKLSDSQLFLYVDEGDKILPKAMNIMNEHNLPILSVRLSRPTLDDVFLKLTGRSMTQSESTINTEK